MLDYEEARGIEDILDGLQCLYDNGNLCEYCNKVQCPYWVEGYELGSCGGYSIVSDAIEALKPRVMTLDEVVTAKPGTVVWLEDFDKPDVISGLLKRLFISTKVIDFLIVKEEVNNEVTADLEVYGSGWRCWTSKPTKTQRKEVKWE